jgi:hypothetical protein
MIAAGYEDGNDANSLRVYPIFMMAHDLAPSDRERVRNRPSRDWRTCRTSAPCYAWGAP